MAISGLRPLLITMPPAAKTGIRVDFPMPLHN
jgi:hypothetical protein